MIELNESMTRALIALLAQVSREKYPDACPRSWWRTGVGGGDGERCQRKKGWICNLNDQHAGSPCYGSRRGGDGSDECDWLNHRHIGEHCKRFNLSDMDYHCEGKRIAICQDRRKARR